MLLAGETVNKVVNFPRWKGRVCAGNPRRVSCAIEIISFQNFYKVLKTCSAGRKSFFAPLSGQQLMLLAGKTLYFFAVLLTGSGSHTTPLRLKFFKSPHVAFCTVRTIWAVILHGAPSNRRIFPDKLAVTLESSFFKNCIDFFYCQIVLPVFDIFDRISIFESTFIIGI